MITICTNC